MGTFAMSLKDNVEVLADSVIKLLGTFSDLFKDPKINSGIERIKNTFFDIAELVLNRVVGAISKMVTKIKEFFDTSEGLAVVQTGVTLLANVFENFKTSLDSVLHIYEMVFDAVADGVTTLLVALQKSGFFELINQISSELTNLYGVLESNLIPIFDKLKKLFTTLFSEGGTGLAILNAAVFAASAAFEVISGTISTAINVGGTLLGWMIDFTGYLMDEVVPTIGVVLLGAFTGLTAYIVATSIPTFISFSLSLLKSVIPSIISTTISAAGMLATFVAANIAMLPIIGTGAAIVAGFALLGYGVQKLVEHFGGWKKVTQELWDTMMAFVNWIGDKGKSIANMFGFGEKAENLSFGEYKALEAKKRELGLAQDLNTEMEKRNKIAEKGLSLDLQKIAANGDYFKTIAQLEGGKDIHAISKDGGAFGKYQIRGSILKQLGEDPTKFAASDEAHQDEVYKRYKAGNDAQLKGNSFIQSNILGKTVQLPNGQSITMDQTALDYLAHRGGVGSIYSGGKGVSLFNKDGSFNYDARLADGGHIMTQLQHFLQAMAGGKMTAGIADNLAAYKKQEEALKGNTDVTAINNALSEKQIAQTEKLLALSSHELGGFGINSGAKGHELTYLHDLGQTQDEIERVTDILSKGGLSDTEVLSFAAELQQAKAKFKYLNEHGNLSRELTSTSAYQSLTNRFNVNRSNDIALENKLSKAYAKGEDLSDRAITVILQGGTYFVDEFSLKTAGKTIAKEVKKALSKSPAVAPTNTSQSKAGQGSPATSANLPAGYSSWSRG